MPIKIRALNRVVAWFTLFAIGLVARIGATTIDPLLWQQLADQANLIGVVECVRAGGNVARYRVVEVWKGDVQVGDVVSIRANGTTLEKPKVTVRRLPINISIEQHRSW